MFVSKVGNPCPTLGQLLVSRILYALLVGENSTKSPGQDFVHRVAQKLANSWSIPRQLPTPWEVAQVFLAIVLWQHPDIHRSGVRSYPPILDRQCDSPDQRGDQLSHVEPCFTPAPLF